MANEKRLIDANALMAEYCDGCQKEIQEDCKTFPVCATMMWVVEAPTVDAVEVVRCKDCKHYKPQFQGAHRNCTTPYCMRCTAVKVAENDFCSYGERKDND